MSDEQRPMTFLDKVEHTFEELRNELVNLFTDHALIHSLTSDAKMKVISHAAEHFSEEAHGDLIEALSQLQKDYTVVTGDAMHLQAENEQLKSKVQALEIPPIAAVSNANSSQNSSSDQPNDDNKAP